MKYKRMNAKCKEQKNVSNEKLPHRVTSQNITFIISLTRTLCY